MEACLTEKDCLAAQFTGTGDTAKCRFWRVVAEGKGSGEGDCYIKETSKMTKVDFMANADVMGTSLNPLKPASIESPGELYAPFANEAIGKICVPKKEVAESILKEIMKEMDKTTGFVKYIVELQYCW